MVMKIRTFVYLHEEGVNDDGAAMNCHVESGDDADSDQFLANLDLQF